MGAEEERGRGGQGRRQGRRAHAPLRRGGGRRAAGGGPGDVPGDCQAAGSRRRAGVGPPARAAASTPAAPAASATLGTTPTSSSRRGTRTSGAPETTRPPPRAPGLGRGGRAHSQRRRAQAGLDRSLAPAEPPGPTPLAHVPRSPTPFRPPGPSRPRSLPSPVRPPSGPGPRPDTRRQTRPLGSCFAARHLPSGRGVGAPLHPGPRAPAPGATPDRRPVETCSA